MKNVRQVTKSVNPREQAVWTLGALYGELRRWAYEVYDTTEHGTLGQTPKDAFEMGLLRSGSRPKQWIAYDEDFIQLTLPSTRKGTAKLVPGKGVKIHHIYYWSKENVFLDHPELENKQLPVRYDPYDVGHVFVLITGHRQAVECISEHHAQFKGRSERELQIATEELRERNTRHSQQFTVTAAKLARFITSVEAQEVLLSQRKRDYEARAVFSLMEGSMPLAMQESASPGTMAEVNQTEAERGNELRDDRAAQESSGSTNDNDIYEDF